MGGHEKYPTTEEVETHLVFATLATVRSLDIHDENAHVLALGHPDSCSSKSAPALHTAFPALPRTLRSLPPLRLVHDVELGPEQPVEESTCTRAVLALLLAHAAQDALFPVD